MRTILSVALLVFVGWWLLSSNGSFNNSPTATSTATSTISTTIGGLWEKIRSTVSGFFDGKGVSHTATSTATSTKTSTATATPSKPVNASPQLGVTKVLVGGEEVLVEIADTDLSRERGLSGRESLPEGRGMLFVFDTPDRYGFWMKDMKFPIDIIWIDSNFRIILIKEVVSPSTYPTLFRSTDPALYVLEVPSGFSTKYNLSVGNAVRIIEE